MRWYGFVVDMSILSLYLSVVWCCVVWEMKTYLVWELDKFEVVFRVNVSVVKITERCLSSSLVEKGYLSFILTNILYTRGKWKYYPKFSQFMNIPTLL